MSLGFNMKGPGTTSYRQIDRGNNVVKVKISTRYGSNC